MVIKMKEKILRKTLVCVIIVLFIGAGAATGINGKINRNDITEKTLINSSTITDQNMCSLNFHTFDKTALLCSQVYGLNKWNNTCVIKDLIRNVEPPNNLSISLSIPKKGSK